MNSLSILIPTIRERESKFTKLVERLAKLSGHSDFVEILGLWDNKFSTVGDKRNKLLSIAGGDFCVFIDDDDDVADDYFSKVFDV